MIHASLAGLALTSLVACGDLADLAGLAPDLPEAPDVSGPPIPPDPDGPDAGEDAPQPPAPPDDGSAPLQLSGLEPTSGAPAGGADILIRGLGFRDGLYVLFGAAVAEDVFVVDTRTAIVRLPPHPPGPVDVTIGHAELNLGEPIVLPRAFTYEATRTVDAVSPPELPTAGGVPFTVTGTGFDATTRPLVAGRLAISPAFVDDRTLTATSPPGPFGWAAIQLVSDDGLSTHPRRVFLYEPPRLDAAAPVAGTSPALATLHGRGLVAEASVTLGGIEAEVVGATRDGRTLTLELPPGLTAGPHAVTVQTRWGTARLEPGLVVSDGPPACGAPSPASASAEGGDRVFIPCPIQSAGTGGVQADAAPTVLVGSRVATVVSFDGAGVVFENPGGVAGPTTLSLLPPGGGGPERSFPFTLVSPAGALRVDAVTPASGPPEGGGVVRIDGAGFSAGVAVVIGALGALRTELVSPTRLDVTVPPGSPGPADVKAIVAGRAATLANGYRYEADTLDLFGVAPDFVAQSGGTRVVLSGTGFGEDARVDVGGVPCPVIARPSSSTLIIRSPRVDAGPHDVRVWHPDRGTEVLREDALVAFDPRSGFGGTWGPPIDGTLNVTVYGSNGHGPIDGAHVIVGSDPATPYQGYTDDRGQVSLSEPGLAGPLTVTASAEGFSAASVVNFDAENVTITLQMNPIPPPPSEGEGGGDPPPPAFVNATLSGRVIGLDKYVLAPPGTCESLIAEEVPDCTPCDTTGASCGEDPEVACVSAGAIDGPRCLRACSVDGDCGTGYRCGATPDGARCIPSPGRRSAQCNVTSTSVFGYNYPLQPGSVPDADGRYTLDSRRLGDLAVYCFGGYLQDNGAFIPTVLGVRRRIFATSGANMTDLDVELRHPLRRTFRVRLADPPTWTTPLQAPNIAFSLNLGADGGIGFSRDPQPAVGGEPDTWLLPRQLGALTGDLYDASYVFYTTLTPLGAVAGQPRSFNLVQAIRRIVEDRLPVRDSDGRWSLEGTQLERSLHGLWRGTDDRLVAVGEAGTVLVRLGARWTPQTSPTGLTLRAVHGRAGDDIVAVGDGGAAIRWDGLRWSHLEAPHDDYGAVLVTERHILATGAVRLRVLARETGDWRVGGGPGVTGLRTLVDMGDGTVLAAGDDGQVWQWSESATVLLGQTDGSDWRAAARLEDDSGGVVLVGRGGAVGHMRPQPDGSGFDFETLRAPRADGRDLTAVAAAPDGSFLAVGDHGVVVSGHEAGALRDEVIEDYRSRAEGVVFLSDGSARVVGSAAFILGPFLGFPRATSPVGDTLGPDRILGWTWDSGPDNQYTRLALTPEYQLTAWVLVVDGHVQTVTLPDLVAAADIDVLPAARYRFEMLRVLNRSFDIDNYTNRGFNLYLRDSWSTNQHFFRID